MVALMPLHHRKQVWQQKDQDQVKEIVIWMDEAMRAAQHT